MKLCCGIDLHSNNSVIALTTEQGEAVFQKRAPNDLDTIRALLKPYQKQIMGIVVESTFNWYWLVDGLIDAGYLVHLANPAALQQYEGLKYSDDHHDARWLSQLLWLGILKEGYIYPKETRAVRDLARKRLQLVQQKVAHLLSIQTLISRNTGRQAGANEIRCLTEEMIHNHIQDANVALAMISNLKVFRCLETQIEVIEKTVTRQIKLMPEFRLLKSVSGIGNILSLTIMLETGDIKRFEKVGNYASYCRCVDSRRMSNGKKKGSGNSKNGNKYLAWAYVEAANFAIRYNPTIKRYYQKKKSKTNNVVAIKAVAHKLARACFYILRDQVPFDVNKAFYS